NGFVGYALQYRWADGEIVYDYFDRYPPFFSALMNGVLTFAGDTASQVRAARAAMNVVFIATVFTATALAYRFTRERWSALA
ncbi:MAG: hypothetical protein AAF125_00135, partial [Chloroflexota bacterium]